MQEAGRAFPQLDLGRVAQWESACFTRKRSEVQNLPRPPVHRRSGLGGVLVSTSQIAAEGAGLVAAGRRSAFSSDWLDADGARHHVEVAQPVDPGQIDDLLNLVVDAVEHDAGVRG